MFIKIFHKWKCSQHFAKYVEKLNKQYNSYLENIMENITKQKDKMPAPRNVEDLLRD